MVSFFGITEKKITMMMSVLCESFSHIQWYISVNQEEIYLSEHTLNIIIINNQKEK